ncbi:hypothetical protein D9757_003458 [Collybiopsis confluens]|uniref:ABC transporter domain-containing protein n=1 Tax=Collybiopsis confluens TaxID=2823264 RepID=A0A8H5HTY9_9AGAR|nr:hypothetical protein D9757_003458 [Collybiopsis confluens]
MKCRLQNTRAQVLMPNTDHETDAVIQETLRRELSDVTLITVAHRLATVIDFDRIVEFDSPKQLLENERGMFRALVDGSADRKKLYATVKEKAL